MKFKNASFIKSAYSKSEFPHHRYPEFAFSGRSNVGKSSLINKLVNQKNLARVSSTPGHTQCINFFNVNNEFCLVDLPGYGFARVPDEVKEDWQELINDYLYERYLLSGVVQIIDARHEPTKEDIMMIDWLESTSLPAIIAATKADKLSGNQLNSQKKIIQKTLEPAPGIDFTFFSTKTGRGLKEVRRFILDILNSSK